MWLYPWHCNETYLLEHRADVSIPAIPTSVGALEFGSKGIDAAFQNVALQAFEHAGDSGCMRWWHFRSLGFGNEAHLSGNFKMKERKIHTNEKWNILKMITTISLGSIHAIIRSASLNSNSCMYMWYVTHLNTALVPGQVAELHGALVSALPRRLAAVVVRVHSKRFIHMYLYKKEAKWNTNETPKKC